MYGELVIVEGDTLPLIRGKLEADISEGWEIALHIDYPEPIAIPAQITDGPAGLFQFVIPGDQRIRGKWAAEVQVVSPEGILTYQEDPMENAFTLDIRRQIK